MLAVWSGRGWDAPSKWVEEPCSLCATRRLAEFCVSAHAPSSPSAHVSSWETEGALGSPGNG